MHNKKSPMQTAYESAIAGKKNQRFKVDPRESDGTFNKKRNPPTVDNPVIGVPTKPKLRNPIIGIPKQPKNPAKKPVPAKPSNPAKPSKKTSPAKGMPY